MDPVVHVRPPAMFRGNVLKSWFQAAVALALAGDALLAWLQ